MTDTTWYVVIGFGAVCLTMLMWRFLSPRSLRRRRRARAQHFTPSELWPPADPNELVRDSDAVYFRHLHKEDPAQPI